MAIVFVSPREKQKAFLVAIVIFSVIVFAIIGLAIFLSSPKKPQGAGSRFVAPQIEIDFDVLTSPEILNLVLMPEMDLQFSYKGINSSAQEQTGKISAPTERRAREILSNLGLVLIIELKEVGVGRENPFSPIGTSTQDII